mmetsp:Transcript_36856/g.80564  ORF Transcript_36856/g.80564 Transcript_36856/m.80564 type:complete len:222 (-) Transcript_36856:512-1177(-)
MPVTPQRRPPLRPLLAFLHFLLDLSPQILDLLGRRLAVYPPLLLQLLQSLLGLTPSLLDPLRGLPRQLLQFLLQIRLQMLNLHPRRFGLRHPLLPRLSQRLLGLLDLPRGLLVPDCLDHRLRGRLHPRRQRVFFAPLLRFFLVHQPLLPRLGLADPAAQLVLLVGHELAQPLPQRLRRLRVPPPRLPRGGPLPRHGLPRLRRLLSQGQLRRLRPRLRHRRV